MEEYKKEEVREIVLVYHPQDDRFEEARREDLEEAVPMWKDAVNPPEGRKIRWRAPVLAILLTVVGILCLAAGLTLTWHSAVRYAEDNVVPEEPYYWENEQIEDEEAHLPAYPSGGDFRMVLSPVPADTKPLDPGAVYEKMSPSTVAVLGQKGDMSSVGTGVILSADGYIITNYHVIAGCTSAVVLVTNEYNVDTPYEAEMVGGDRDLDLAVLKIDGTDLPAAEFGSSDDLAIGDKVYAIGNPLGLELRSTFTDGIVSAVNREVDVDGVTMTLVQTNTALNSGNSGGPLISQYGQVIGINTIKMMGGTDTIEGLGFAIPTSLAVRWINQILEDGEVQPTPILGIMINRIPVVLPDESLGLEVVEVTPGLGGEKAGILAGDVLVAFNGTPVHRIEEVMVLRRDLNVGDEVPVTIFRDGEYIDLTMEMMAPPN